MRCVTQGESEVVPLVFAHRLFGVLQEAGIAVDRSDMRWSRSGGLWEGNTVASG